MTKASGASRQEKTTNLIHTLKNEMEEDSNQPIGNTEPGFGARQVHRLFAWFSKVDTRAVKERVTAIRGEFPNAEAPELIELLIRRKCEHTAKIGAATAATGSIPVLGTIFSLTVGMLLDLGAVITSQAELVLEIAEVLDVPLSEAKKRETVFLVMGIGAGAQRLSARASQQVLNKLAQRYARRWLSHTIPVLGIAAAAAINAISTYLIGRRAQAYFGQGPKAMGDWKTSLRALSGVDELKLSEWLNNLFGKNPLGSLIGDQKIFGKDPQELTDTVIGKGKELADKALHLGQQTLEYGQQTYERFQHKGGNGQTESQTGAETESKSDTEVQSKTNSDTEPKAEKPESVLDKTDKSTETETDHPSQKSA